MSATTDIVQSRSPRTMGFTELKTWLRHQHPMVYLDRVLDYEPGVFLKTSMAVSGQIDAISGHFPERAVFPASHLMQAIAQSAIILFQLSTSRLDDDEITLVGSVKARFTKIVVPGEIVVFRTKIDSLRDGFLMFSCRASVDDKPVGTLRGSLVRQKIADLGEQLW